MAADDYAWLREYWEGFDDATIEDYLTIYSQPEARTATVNWYRAMFQVAPTFEYGDITTPTLYIWGNEDIALGRTGAEATAKFMKGPYEFVELDAGHWLMQFNEPQVSQMIMDHIEKFPMD